MHINPFFKQLHFLRNKMELWFDFHGVNGLHISTQDAEAADFFRAEYASHQCDVLPTEQARVELVINPGKFPDGLTIQTATHKALARWKYAVQFESEQKVSIFIEGNSWAIPMIHHMLVHPSLRWLSAQNGELLLHAGAVAIGGRSLILTGKGGAGKTTTTSMLLANGQLGWSLHGDDYVFLSPGPVSFAYLTRSHLYRDLLKWVPEIKGVLTTNEQVRLEILGRIRRWSGERLKWPVRLPASRLWPGRKLEQCARPAGIVFLRKGNVDQPLVEPATYNTDLLQELLDMNFFEARHFLHLVGKTQQTDWLVDWRQRERQLLETLLKTIPIYLLILPSQVGDARQMRLGLVEQLEKLVLG
jgi:hypothetical protein